MRAPDRASLAQRPDAALEALRDCRCQHKRTNDELWYYAEISRVANVMRPYLEAIA
jgi:hypothetical protein